MSVTAAAEQPHAFYVNDHWSADISAAPSGRSDSASKLTTFAEEEPSFWDLLDVVNPLQHIPVLNSIYRELTGDKIGVGAQVAGGALFGGPIGLVAAGLQVAIQDATGDDIGGHVLALFRDDGGDGPDDGATQLAAADPAPPPAPPATDGAMAAGDAFLLEPPPASMPTAPTMWFQKEGGSAPAPAVAQAAPVPLAPAAAAPARFMPLPPRGAVSAGTNAPPPVSVPISNSGTRSNVPITGRDPVPTTPSPLAVQKIIGQEKATAGPAPQDWFSSAMANGLDKYEQAARLNRPGPAAPVTVE